MNYRDTPCRVTMETNAYYSKMAKREMRNEMTDNEIREEILESSEWTYDVAEQIVDQVTDQQWSILSNYILSHAPHMRRQDDREAEVGRYALEILLPIVAKTLQDSIENYKDKHDITYGTEDE